MRKNVMTFIVGLIAVIIIGVFVVYPGIFASLHHMSFFETWHNMFAFIP